MLSADTLVRLGFALAAALYLLVGVADGLRGEPLLVSLLGAAAIAVWLAAPERLAAAGFALPLLVRRAGVLGAGAGALFSYVAIRRGARSGDSPGSQEKLIRLVSSALLVAGGTLASAHWIAATGTVLLAIAARPRSGQDAAEKSV